MPFGYPLITSIEDLDEKKQFRFKNRMKKIRRNLKEQETHELADEAIDFVFDDVQKMLVQAAVRKLSLIPNKVIQEEVEDSDTHPTPLDQARGGIITGLIELK